MKYKRASATVSDCGNYRYRLDRDWDNRGSPERTCTFIMLNPSTADGTRDDPTIRRYVSFANRWGYNRLCVVNLFALRATDPAAMMAAVDPVGPDNSFFLWGACVIPGLIVCAWGEHGSHRGQDRIVLKQITHDVRCLGVTKSGQPRHPLYVRGDTYPELYTPSWRAE